MDTQPTEATVSALSPKKRRLRRRVLAPAVLQAIRDHAANGYAAREVLGLLDRQFDDPLIPSLRTVQRVLADITPSGGRWTFGPGEVTPGPDYDHLVLDTLGAVVTATEGRVASFTQDEADLIVRIRRARPDFDPFWAFRFARRYLEWRIRGEPTEALDLQLATLNRVGAGLSGDKLDERAKRKLATVKRSKDGGPHGTTR